MNTGERQTAAKTARLCINCLKDDHHVNYCTATSCKKCNKWHNTLLHYEQGQQIDKHTSQKDDQQNSNTATNIQEPSTCLHNTSESIVLLSTAKIQVNSNENKWVVCKGIARHRFTI